MTNKTQGGTVTVSRYIKVSTIADLYDMTTKTAYKIAKDPSFPEPIVLLGGHYRYPADEVQAWFEEKRTRPMPRAKAQLGTLETGPVLYGTLKGGR